MMGFFKRSLPVCLGNQHCSQWARIYLKYCLCSVKDGVSLTLGLMSVISWGVAELPQIITNYKQKSTEGLSIAFLTTWIIGDLFNLFGCLLEPATLPTQLYMAMLYSITSTILTSQTIYYGYIYNCMKANRRDLPNKDLKFHPSVTVDEGKHTDNAVGEKQVKLGDSWTNGSNIVQGAVLPSSPIPVAAPVLAHINSLGRDLYYMSARSLARSQAPSVGSYLSHLHGQKRADSIPNHNPHSVEEPLLGVRVSAQSAPPFNTKSMLCVISAVTFFVSSLNVRHSINNRTMVLEKPTGVVIQVGRKLLQNNGISLLRDGTEGSTGIGTFLGWTMAAIYMGGRLPQIWLNIRRGKVEGLNPLMFIFALLGNGTYVASILVSSLDWSKIRPNLPWLVDAGGCVCLDTFILIQFIYFRYRKLKDLKNARGDCFLQA